MKSQLFVIALGFAAASQPASAAEILGSYGIAYAKTTPYDPSATVSSYTSGNDEVSASAGSTGFSSYARAQTSAWNNRIETSADLTAAPPPSPDFQTFAFAAAQSFYAVNQILSGPGATAQMSYQFSVDGSFVTGPDNLFPPTQSRQNLGVSLVAYYGTALDTFLDAETGIFYLRTDNGLTSLNVLPENPGYIDENFNYIIPGSFAYGCAAPVYYCTSSIDFNNALLTIDVDVEVGRTFMVAALLTTYNNGKAEFFNTVKLNSISLDPAYTLTADDGGALRRNADGTYALAASVPEPAAWATMLFGLSVIGGAMRYRRRPKVVVRYA